MSDEKIHEANVRVLNEEYERVLANPENIIVSDDLQELLDLPVKNLRSSEIDTMVVSILDSDGLPIAVRGEFSCLSKSFDEYSVIVTCTKVKKDFLQALNRLSASPGMLTMAGEYDIEIQDCEVISWSVTQTGDADFSLSIQFRSKNDIF